MSSPSALASPEEGSVLARQTLPRTRLSQPEHKRETPEVIIQGDLRLRVSASIAASRPIEGSYRIEAHAMQEPLHVLWMIEGNVIDHHDHILPVSFDLREVPVDETCTYLITAQVTENNGQGGIALSSVFVQITIVEDDIPSYR